MKFPILFVFFCLASNGFAHPQTSQNKTIERLGKTSRIVGGQTAKTGQFPWQVGVYFDNAKGSFFAGGALIHPEWVLTGAHVVYGAKVFTIQLGSNSLGADADKVIITATEWAAHPAYDPESLDNDIGLIHLSRPAVLSDKIQPVLLADKRLEADEKITLSGWGASGDWNGVELNLKFVSLTVITNEKCAAIYGDIVTDKMGCAVGILDEGPCDGDSGGALVQYDEDNVAYHVGVSTWTTPEGCHTTSPSGFTRTDEFVDWINIQINNNDII